MPFLSLVIPVYNSEETISRTLDSILGQGYDDFEVLCIDDGSTDSTAAVLAEYASKDRRIKVFSKENGGVSSARNRGLEEATADYIWFVDSDDLIEPHACQVITDALNRSPVDVLIFGATCDPAEDAFPWMVKALDTCDTEPFILMPDAVFTGNLIPFAWRNVFSVPFLRREGLRFPESLHVGEDQAFQLFAYGRKPVMMSLSRRLYRYSVSRELSAMKKAERDIASKLEQHIEQVSLVLDDWEDIGLLENDADGILDWSFGFLLREILAQKPGVRETLFLKAARVWMEHYAPEDLKRYASDNPFKKKIVGIMVDCPGVIGGFAWKVWVFGYRASASRYASFLTDRR